MDYRDPDQCLSIIRQLRPLKIEDTHASLTGLIGGMLQTPPEPLRHLEVLEAARAVVAVAQAELSSRYAAHPLPPDSRENEILRRVESLWRLMERSYAALAANRAAVLEDQHALCRQRELHYLSQILFEYFRAHRSLPAGLWQQLHGAYQAAESEGCARIRVVDPQNEVWKAQSASEAHISALLVELANPFGRSSREFEWVCRWAQRFAAYCSLEKTNTSGKGTNYALDLVRDHGLRPGGVLQACESLRYFDGSRLAGQIQSVVAQLKQGVTPASLGLGEDAATNEVGHLLVWLYRPWGLASAGRRFPRRRSSGVAGVCADWRAIGFHILGRDFEPPKTFSTQRSLQSDIELITFGERVESRPIESGDVHHRAETLGFAPQSWVVLDHSVGGFRLSRLPDGKRLEHLQLVGIRPPDGDRYLLGQVSWLMYQSGGEMEVGVNVLAGIPQVVAARPVGLYVNPHEPYSQAFLLPAVPSMKVDYASLVLPSGWFSPQRIIEIHAGKAMQMRLLKLLVRGTNFDQVSFEPL